MTELTHLERRIIDLLRLASVPMSSTELAAIIWPTKPAKDGVNGLKVALSKLRSKGYTILTERVKGSRSWTGYQLVSEPRDEAAA